MAQLSFHERLLRFITCTNWLLYGASSFLAVLMLQRNFALGIICGGLIVTVNFHLLGRTLKKVLNPKHISKSTKNAVMLKYYIRFTISGIIIFLLISKKFVDPIGLILGLSVVVVSIFIATMYELTRHFSKEAI